jgi:hypothetical protein
MAATPSQAADADGAARIEEFVTLWTGHFSNERQVLATKLAGQEAYAGAINLLRDIRVRRVEAPEIGPLVLFLEEVKADRPDVAHRQRVMTFRLLPETQEVQVEQLFFSMTLTYDRPFLDPSEVAKMKRADFTHVEACDLFFRWNAEQSRFEGGMRPRLCEYDHPESGRVFAEFDMTLSRDALSYRDRSIILATGAIRGEIHGFSWIVYDRSSDAPDLPNGDRIARDQMLKLMPVMARMEGVWEGMFRRYDAEGVLTEAVPSRVELALLPDGEAFDYRQVNITRKQDGSKTRIESQGKWDVDRLRFSNPRVEGWAYDLVQDPEQLTSVFLMTFKDGTTLSEIVTLSPDGKRRMRAAQYMKDGTILRRTLIDEMKVAETAP